MSARKKWIIFVVILSLLLVAAAVVAILGVILPYQRAQSTMPANGTFVIEQQTDGSLVLNWPVADQADYYCLEVLLPAASEEEEPEIVYKDFIKGGTSCILPGLPDTMELTLRISSVVEYQQLTETRIRYGDRAMEVTTRFNIPEVTDVVWTADPDTQTVSVDFAMQEGDNCYVYVLGENDERTQVQHLTSNHTDLVFGETGDLTVPKFGKSHRLGFSAYREEPGLTFIGTLSAEMIVVRDDLLGTNLDLVCTDDGYNVCTLTWKETKGQHYEVQMYNANAGLWVTVYQVPGDGERTYTSGHLDVYSNYTYRVIAVGGQTMEGSDYAAISEELTFTTAESPIFATIWPTKNMAAYKDTARTEEAGEVEVGRAYCVLEEKDGMFGVGLDGEVCYIDSNYCMINLPEYVGDLCSYQITNSYSSIYMVHEFEIPKVTDVITSGYENIRLSDGSYLVPLLYPTAKKLVNAAESAVAQGYRLKIYDSFRPYKATREIYDITAAMLDDELPEKTFTGVKRSSLKLPSPQEVEQEDGTMKEMLTYRMVMCGDRYNLGYFLAKSGSLHNLGIAVDLTLEEVSSGEEISMQTSMHDLSQYSVLSRNNTAANTLATIMKGAGFGDLVSEWWHFQDNEARSELSPPTVSYGVSAACWMADDHGWKYRTARGNYYANETVSIGGVEYTFDADGYVVTE